VTFRANLKAVHYSWIRLALHGIESRRMEDFDGRRPDKTIHWPDLYQAWPVRPNGINRARAKN